MDKTGRQMLDTLKKLRDDFGIIAVKAEFEAEGSRTDELVMLNEIVYRADMDLYVKIGGCEGIRDLDQCRLLGASGIMAPMIETPFAMKKFVAAANKVYGDRLDSMEWIINAETKTCRENLDDILEVGKGFLNTVSIGRVDLSGSMGLTRAEINGDEVFEATCDIATRSKKAGYNVNFGGGISFDAIPFIIRMYGYTDRFETRKIVFRASNDEKTLKLGILTAMEFEILYLKNKCAFYNRMASEDAQRLVMLEKRLESAKASL
ncbi:MAG: aldolase [Clostridiales bacterium]|nr:aldolase [Clostridiales bacterium]